MKRTRFFTLLTGILLAGSLAGPATAAGPALTVSDGLALYEQLLASSDPASAYLALSPAEQGAVLEVLRTTTVEVMPDTTSATAVGDTIVLAAGGCWYAQKGIQGKSVAGVVLWQYNLKINWCSDGSKVTSKSQTHWPSNMALGWSYDTSGGWPIVTQTGGVGKTYYEVWTQAHMQFCVPLAGCVQHQYPWVDVRGNANGTYSASAGA